LLNSNQTEPKFFPNLNKFTQINSMAKSIIIFPKSNQFCQIKSNQYFAQQNFC